MLDKIQRCLEEGNWRISYHAIKRCDARDIALEDLLTAIAVGEVIEEYPNDPRGASCLVLGRTPDGKPLHVVCAINREGWVIIITAYYPEEPKWVDERTRRRNQ
ncbi:MAG: DUF4258 domain-containing protein [Moorellaceae bacterium]